MNNLTNEQKQKIVGNYLGGEYVYIVNGKIYGTPNKIKPITLENTGIGVHIKILATPLSAMKLEHAVYIMKLRGDGCGSPQLEIGDGYFKVYNEGGSTSIDFNNLSYMEASYLIKEGYDLPQYIDIDHPDNGNTAIELGLAIDKTTL